MVGDAVGAFIGSLWKTYRPVLLRRGKYLTLREHSVSFRKLSEDVAFALQFSECVAGRLLGELKYSKSEIRQDLFVLTTLQFKRDGFFVEFGAADGMELSNTYMLEKRYGWTGIVAEPAAIWHDDLKRNRSCVIETDCVWRASNEKLSFKEARSAALSTIGSFGENDWAKKLRKNSKQYMVNTISLNDLLAKNNAPGVVDYLSIDTEGSEFDILSAVDFEKYKFRVITCEHNHTDTRDKLYQLLTANGYTRTFEQFSHCDDWYVNSNL